MNHNLHFKEYESFLTNGDISIKIVPTRRTSFGIEIPDGVVIAEDSKGNIYLNGLLAHFELRCTHDSNLFD